jgi:beta-lactamase regulating signal transducer with metallopeptidase domain
MHAFWEIVASNSLVVVVLAVCVALLSRHWKNPVGVHLLWVFVLLKLVTPPVVTIPVPLSVYEPPFMAAQQEANQDVIDSSSVEVSREEEVASVAMNRQDQRAPEEWAASESLFSPTGVTASAAERHRMPWLTVLAWAWGAGIALFGSGHAYRILWFRSLLRAAEAPPSTLLGMAEGIGKRLGLTRIPEIALLPARLSPLVWSIGGRPRVLLPAALFERLDADAQQAILAHELAHVGRKDHWVRLLELVVATLFWWHPVVWWACRQLRELEEQCCDGLVLGTVSHGAKAYATALLDTLDFLSDRSVALPLIATGAKSPISLARRIKMLKKKSPEVRLTTGRLLFLLALTTVPMALAFAAKPLRTPEGAVVAVLDDCDPNYKGEGPHGDGIRLLAADGKEVYSRKSLNNCETIGANHGVILDPQQRRVYFRELVSHRVTAIDFMGRTMFEVDGIKATALAVDLKTGNLWCLTGGSLGAGETIVLDGNGRRTTTYPIDGFDIAYDSHDDAFWIVGPRARKVNRQGEVLCEGPRAGWSFVSVASNPRDGSVWIAERKHPDVAGSVNRLSLLDRKGQALRKIELGDQGPFGVACDPRTGMVWAVIWKKGVLRVPVEGKPLPPLDISATSIAIGAATAQVWIATEEEVLRLDKDGKPVARYALGRRSSQSWITAR